MQRLADCGVPSDAMRDAALKLRVARLLPHTPHDKLTAPFIDAIDKQGTAILSQRILAAAEAQDATPLFQQKYEEYIRLSAGIVKASPLHILGACTHIMRAIGLNGNLDVSAPLDETGFKHDVIAGAMKQLAAMGVCAHNKKATFDMKSLGPVLRKCLGYEWCKGDKCVYLNADVASVLEEYPSLDLQRLFKHQYGYKASRLDVLDPSAAQGLDDLNAMEEQLAVPEIIDNDPFVSHKRARADEATQPRWESLRRKVAKALATAPVQSDAPSKPSAPVETPYEQDVRLARELAYCNKCKA